MNRIEKEIRKWYLILISLLILLLLHEAIIMFINIYIGNLSDVELLEVVKKDWYNGFINYAANYNAVKTLIFGVLGLLLIMSLFNLHKTSSSGTSENNASQNEVATKKQTISDNVNEVDS